MKTLIFADGFGARISEENCLRPKPMIRTANEMTVHRNYPEHWKV